MKKALRIAAAFIMSASLLGTNAFAAEIVSGYGAAGASSGVFGAVTGTSATGTAVAESTAGGASTGALDATAAMGVSTTTLVVGGAAIVAAAIAIPLAASSGSSGGSSSPSHQ